MFLLRLLTANLFQELKNVVVEDKKPDVLDLGSDGEKESGEESQSDEDDDVRISTLINYVPILGKAIQYKV